MSCPTCYGRQPEHQDPPPNEILSQQVPNSQNPLELLVDERKKGLLGMSRPHATPKGSTLEACLQCGVYLNGDGGSAGTHRPICSSSLLLGLGLLHSCCNSTALASCPPAGPAVVTCSTQHLSRQASLTHPGAITKGPQGPRLTHA